MLSLAKGALEGVGGPILVVAECSNQLLAFGDLDGSFFDCFVCDWDRWSEDTSHYSFVKSPEEEVDGFFIANGIAC